MSSPAGPVHLLRLEPTQRTGSSGWLQMWLKSSGDGGVGVQTGSEPPAEELSRSHKQSARPGADISFHFSVQGAEV